MGTTYLALVLSDLHLGEEDSILMHLDPSRGVHWPYLEALRGYLVSELDLSEVRYLILLGDALDLSLARRRRAFPALKAFLEVFQGLVSEGIIYIPGNHDHHIWVAFQEETQVFCKLRQDRPVEPYYYVLCPYLDPEGIHLPEHHISRPYGRETFLYHLLPEAARSRDLDLLVAYPHIYLRTEKASALLTHGHFFEETWTLFTDLLEKPLREITHLDEITLAKLEQINAPFIEFGWYSLGQAGELSVLLEKIWDELHERGAGPITESILQDLRDRLDREIHFPWWEAFKEVFSDLCLDGLVQGIKKLLEQQAREKPRSGSSLRHKPEILKEKKTRERIQRYLRLSLPDFPGMNTLVFGHTHIPFQKRRLSLEEDGSSRTISCFNTGGWVTDVYRVSHLLRSRPLVVAFSEEGIRTLEIPWPEKEALAEILPRGRKKPATPEEKERLRRLIRNQLLRA